MAIIYCIINKLNGKKYIGQTVSTMEHRFRKHKGQRNCKTQCSALYAAFRKYGIENFEIKELISGDFSKDELNLLEVSLIAKHKTISPNGYNLQTGGKSFRVSEEVKAKMKKIMANREILWKDKIAVSVKKLWGNEDYRNKMSLSHKGKRGAYKEHKKPLRINIDIDKINKLYANGLTINAIAGYFNVSFSVIKKRINGRN